jgi:hypothetical protein
MCVWGCTHILHYCARPAAIRVWTLAIYERELAGLIELAPVGRARCAPRCAPDAWGTLRGGGGSVSLIAIRNPPQKLFLRPTKINILSTKSLYKNSMGPDIISGGPNRERSGSLPSRTTTRCRPTSSMVARPPTGRGGRRRGWRGQPRGTQAPCCRGWCLRGSEPHSSAQLHCTLRMLSLPPNRPGRGHRPSHPARWSRRGIRLLVCGGVGAVRRRPRRGGERRCCERHQWRRWYPSAGSSSARATTDSASRRSDALMDGCSVFVSCFEWLDV